jgi:hypothetical protein
MLWIGPYSWPSSDHAQDLPPILARLDPSLFTRDFAVQSALGSSPRLVYQVVIASLMRTGLSAAWAHFLCQVATLAAAAVMAFFVSRWMARRFETLSVLSGMAWLALLFPAASHYLWNHAIVDSTNAVAGTFAMGFALSGWYHGLRRHWGVAYLLFGLAALMQVLVGFMGGLLLLPVVLADLPQARKRIWGWASGIAVWISCGIAIALPMLISDTRLPAAELVRIFGRVRAPHHWLPSNPGGWYWINQLLLGFAAVTLGRSLRQTPAIRRLRFVAALVLVVAACCLAANYVFVEHFPVALVAKLQFQRTLPFAHLAILLICVAAWQQMLLQGRITEGIILMVIPIARLDGAALALFAAAMLVRQNGRRGSARILVSIAAMVVLVSLPSPARYPVPPAAILALGIGVAIGLWRHSAIQRLHTALALVAVSASVMTVIAVTRGDVIATRWPGAARVLPSIESYRAVPETSRDLASLLRRVVPREALILMFPGGEMEFVPVLSERSSVISWKNVPYTDDGIAEWDRRISRSIGRTLNSTVPDSLLAAGWASLPASALVEFSSDVGAGYIVSRDEWHRFPSATPVGSAGGWTVWRMR